MVEVVEGVGDGGRHFGEVVIECEGKAVVLLFWGEVEVPACLRLADGAVVGVDVVYCVVEGFCGVVDLVFCYFYCGAVAE